MQTFPIHFADLPLPYYQASLVTMAEPPLAKYKISTLVLLQLSIATLEIDLKVSYSHPLRHLSVSGVQGSSTIYRALYDSTTKPSAVVLTADQR